jgi:hypothetical protein
MFTWGESDTNTHGYTEFDGKEFLIIQPLKHNFNIDIRETDLKDERRMLFIQDRVQWRNFLFCLWNSIACYQKVKEGNINILNPIGYEMHQQV